MWGDSPPRVWRETHIYRPLTLILNIISSWLQSNKEVFSSLIVFTTSYLSRVYYVRKNNTSLFLCRYMVYYGSSSEVLWFAGTLEKVGFSGQYIPGLNKLGIVPYFPNSILLRNPPRIFLDLKWRGHIFKVIVTIFLKLPKVDILWALHLGMLVFAVTFWRHFWGQGCSCFIHLNWWDISKNISSGDSTQNKLL